MVDLLSSAFFDNFKAYQNKKCFYGWKMIISRARPLSRATGSYINKLLQGNYGSNFKQAVRTKVWVQYRNPVVPEEYLNSIKKPYEIFSAAFWWWIIWRFVSEYEEFIGPNIPSMSDWTDEELGIPPLDEDP